VIPRPEDHSAIEAQEQVRMHTTVLPELAQHWVRYKAHLAELAKDHPEILTLINPNFDGFMVWLMEDLSNER
jgi:hypothetical protein